MMVAHQERMAGPLADMLPGKDWHEALSRPAYARAVPAQLGSITLRLLYGTSCILRQPRHR